MSTNEDQCQNILGIGVAAGNLAQLHFIITHQQVNAALSSIFHMGQLFRNTTENDVFCGNAPALYQLKLSLKHRQESLPLTCLKSCSLTRQNTHVLMKTKLIHHEESVIVTQRKMGINS